MLRDEFALDMSKLSRTKTSNWDVPEDGRSRKLKEDMSHLYFHDDTYVVTKC